MKKNSWLFLCALFISWVVAAKYNPLDWFFEAGAPAYYQTKIAYLKGSPSEKESIKTAWSDNKITMHEYQKIVWPAFSAHLKSGDALFPDKKNPSIEELKKDLQLTINTHDKQNPQPK